MAAGVTGAELEGPRELAGLRDFEGLRDFTGLREFTCSGGSTGSESTVGIGVLSVSLLGVLDEPFAAKFFLLASAAEFAGDGAMST